MTASTWSRWVCISMEHVSFCPGDVAMHMVRLVGLVLGCTDLEQVGVCKGLFTTKGLLSQDFSSCALLKGVEGCSGRLLCHSCATVPFLQDCLGEVVGLLDTFCKIPSVFGGLHFHWCETICMSV